MKPIEIYTDGACCGNPGPGGWGALLIFGNHYKKIYGGEKMTTNNRMEITASIKALEVITRKFPIKLYTDSVYLQKGITSWIKKWQINGWKNRNKKPVKNADLWEILLHLINKYEIEWKWIKGHNNIYGNEIADQLARKGMQPYKNN